MSDTPTPETDAAKFRSLCGNDWNGWRWGDVVPAAISRRLERERDALNTKCEQIGRQLVVTERERDEALKELNQWRDAAKGAENPHPDEVHCTCVPLLRGSLELARKERDKALEDAKRATYDAAQETIKVSTVKSHWIEACRERDEAREAFAIATNHAIEAREMLRRIMDWAPCLPDYEPDAQHLKWQSDAHAARKFLEAAK